MNLNVIVRIGNEEKGEKNPTGQRGRGLKADMNEEGREGSPIGYTSSEVATQRAVKPVGENEGNRLSQDWPKEEVIILVL